LQPLEFRKLKKEGDDEFGGRKRPRRGIQERHAPSQEKIGLRRK